ncbi:MAG: hypothetical protein ACLR9S_01360 [Lachnospiraceae bacterium]
MTTGRQALQRVLRLKLAIIVDVSSMKETIFTRSMEKASVEIVWTKHMGGCCDE